MNTRNLRILILILIAAAMLTGCNLPFINQAAPPPPPPPTQDLNNLATLTQQAVEHSIQETLTAPTATSSPTITLTSLPPETMAPSETPPVLSPSQIKFKQGGTLSYHRGGIKAGQQIAYTLEAGGGQTLIVTVSSPDDEVYLEVRELEGGDVLVPFSDGASSVQTKLPWIGEYQITLTSPEDQDYFLTVEVPANLVVSPGMGSSVVTGYIDVLGEFHPDVFTRVRYLVQLQKGSVLDVQLSSPALSNLSLALIGAGDGQPYLRHEVKGTSITGFVVPETQGYYLDVYSVEGASGNFSLSITVQ